MTASASVRASNSLVAWLDDADVDRDRIGGKAASLNRLASLGFRIPPGFCLTTDAFAIQAATLPGGGALRADPTVLLDDAVRNTLVEAMIAGPISPAVAAALAGPLERLAGGPGWGECTVIAGRSLVQRRRGRGRRQLRRAARHRTGADGRRGRRPPSFAAGPRSGATAPSATGPARAGARWRTRWQSSSRRSSRPERQPSSSPGTRSAAGRISCSSTRRPVSVRRWSRAPSRPTRSSSTRRPGRSSSSRRATPVPGSGARRRRPGRAGRALPRRRAGVRRTGRHRSRPRRRRLVSPPGPADHDAMTPHRRRVPDRVGRSIGPGDHLGMGRHAHARRALGARG